MPNSALVNRRLSRFKFFNLILPLLSTKDFLLSRRLDRSLTICSILASWLSDKSNSSSNFEALSIYKYSKYRTNRDSTDENEHIIYFFAFITYNARTTTRITTVNRHGTGPPYQRIATWSLPSISTITSLVFQNESPNPAISYFPLSKSCSTTSKNATSTPTTRSSSSNALSPPEIVCTAEGDRWIAGITSEGSGSF